ncbi:hypothetical protein DL762_001482 [Monosporascus cannonballus]|uniref:Carrier domain-containing protein n=1 Tax=Monosporascus cannonballus TaxID=155416 RepID=A0ABY0HGS4_9PEZI|nr:hypothetical protein DL762_001482 [Monosporascus cannonballus]
MAGRLLLPRVDAPVELPEDGPSYETCSIRSPSTGTGTEKRKSLPRIYTRFPYSKGGDTQTWLLESVSAAVADALGVDPSELPQPFGGINSLSSRTSAVGSQSDDHPSYSSSVYSPTLDCPWSPRDSLIHERLATAVADVLGLEVSRISRGDSFVELGGDLQKARELSANCMAVGLSVEPDDVLACRTIAELETLITPLTTSRSDIAPSPPIVSLSSTDATPRRPQDVAIQPQQPPTVPPKAPGRLSRVAQRKPPQLEDGSQTRPRASSDHNDVEHILSLNSGISQAAVIRPKAGLFEGQAVVFLTLAGYSVRGAVDCEVHFQASHYDKLPPVRKGVEARVPQNYAPKVWVALQQMPLNEFGNINRRKLQTWIQNVNEDVYEQIMSVNPQRNSTPPPSACERHVSWGESGRAKEVFDLSPMQRFYFHTAMGNRPTRQSLYNDEHRFNQSVLLRLNKHADIEDVHAAVEAVVGHHSMLRCRFRPDEDSWCQWIETDISSSYEFSTHIVSTNDEVEEVIRIAQGTIDIERGPVFAAKHFHTHDGYQMLYLVAHRLVIDFKSWRVITNDLDVLLANGHLASGPSLSYSSWVAQQKRHAQTLGASGRSAFPISSSAWDYWGIQDGRNTYGNTAAAGFTLSAGVVSMLGDNNQASKTDCSDIFISALLLSFSRTFCDRAAPTLWNVEHERSALKTRGDISETVGWFTSLCPLALEISHMDDISAVLSLVKETRRSIPARGVPYFTTCMMDAPSATSFVSSHCPMELIFTFAGDIQDLQGQNSVFEQISAPSSCLSSKSSNIGPGVRRTSVFEISAVIDQGEAEFSRSRLLVPNPPFSGRPLLKSTPEELAQLNQTVLPGPKLDASSVVAVYPATGNQENFIMGESLIPGSSTAQVIYGFDTGNKHVDIGRDASFVILFEELERAYLDGRLPDSSQVSYPEALGCLETTPRSIEFWREKLGGCQPCRFPILSAKRTDTPRWENTTVDLLVSREHLAAFATKHNVGMSAVLRVAWALVLRTYVGTDDVCFGYRTSGRDIPVRGLEDVVGCFSTVLPCRISMPAGCSIIPILQACDRQHEEALHHQHVTVSSIQHALNVKGGRIFNTCMSLSRTDVVEGFRSSNKFHHVRTNLSSEYDISVDVKLRFEKVSVDIGHRILNPSQAILVAHAFGRAIQTIIDSLASLVKQVDLFTEHDHKQILAWNSTSQPDICDRPVHELIAVQASANPDIQAVCAWDGGFTYSELYECSMALAGHLTTSGLKAQTLVPVIMDKSRWAVVAMLAVLYSNAVLIPVDAEATSLFSRVIKTVDASFVLISDSVRRYLNNAELEIIVVNEYTVSAMSAQAAAANPFKTTSTDLACILFEHGSPKTHKATAYSHGALAMACVGQGPALRICASSRVMQLSSYSVDIALSEILTTLIHGGCVCVPSAPERLADFTGAAQRMNVNWTYLTPPLSRKLNPEKLTGLAVVCFRQDIDIDTYMSWAGRAKVLVVYSPRGACPLGLSAFEVEDARDIQCIDNPIRGNFWIVSPEDSRRLMPVGAVGELVIMSPAIATEIHLKEASVKEWARNIATTNSSGRGESDCPLLKTGQLVRYREEGRIEIVPPDHEAGRIKGNTAQHSEIESELRRCLGRDTNVAVHTITFGVAEAPPIIAAFIEFGDNSFQGNESLTKLSRFTKERLYLTKQKADMVLRGKLPTDMVPSAYIPVQHLPLTLSLEISRKDLRKMVTGLSRRQILNLTEMPDPLKVRGAELKPLSFAKVENQIRSIWADVLGVPEARIKGSDKFLSLGGDPVLAHKVAVACGEKDIVMSVVDVLRNFSLSELARRITLTQTSTRNNNLSGQSNPSNTSSKNMDIPQFMDWEREQFEDVAEASSLQTLSVEAGSFRTPGNINYFIINISGQVNQHRLESACSRLVEAHPILRTGFALRGRQIFQTVFRPQSYHPEFQRYRSPDWRLSGLTTKLIKRDQSLPVDFRHPLTKFMFIDGGKTSTMVLRLSRAQYDEASLPSLLGHLSRLYNQPDRALSRYPSFCDVVRAAQNQDTNNAAEYWRSLLDGSAMACVVSQPLPAIPAPGSKAIQRQIPIGTMQNLGIPFETILNGAWSIVLSNLSGSDDVVFGQLVEGKSLRLAGGYSVADVVGPSGNIIAVRTRVPGTSTPPYEYLRCIQSQLAASMTHAHMQFADVVRDCTSWPAWTHFSTVVQHAEQHIHDTLKGFALGNAACKVSCLESNLQHSDIFVRSTMTAPANVNVSLTFCEKRVRQSIADEALKMLCSTIALLTSGFVMKPLPFKVLNGRNTTPKIPLPSAPRQDVHLKGPIGSVPLDHAQAINNVIEAAWQTVLDTHVPSMSNIRSVPFYEIWGSLMAAAELARYYTERIPGLNIPGLQHVQLAMEDIIDHPSMAHQYELIIAKWQGPQRRHNSSLFYPAVSNRRAEGPQLASGGMSSASCGLQPDGSGIPAYHCPVSSSSSMKSMTTGSTQSDRDELLDDAKLVGPARGSDKKIRQLLGVDVAKLPPGMRASWTPPMT